MARGSLKNSISDLQLDWATNHPNKSVRDYLMNVKGLTERQYRHIIANAKLVEWQARRQEIQNFVDADKIRMYCEKAAEIHTQFVDAAKLNLERVTEHLEKSSDLSSQDLLNLTRAIAQNQITFHRAMGISSDDGLNHVYLDFEKRIKEERSTEPKLSESVANEGVQKLTDEDILAFIEWRRESKKRAKSEEAPELLGR